MAEIEEYIGLDGKLKKVLYKWKGKDGQWELVGTDDPIDELGPFYVNQLDGWTANPGNVIKISGQKLTDQKYPTPKVGGFFDLESNFAEYFQNFASAIGVAGIAFATIGGEAALHPVDAAQYGKTDFSASGITALGVLGAAGTKDYGISIWAYIATADMPGAGEKKWLWWGGITSEAYFGVYVGDDGNIHWVHFDGTNTAEVISSAAFTPDAWNKIIVNRNGSDYTQSKMLLDGAEVGAMPSAVNPIVPDGGITIPTVAFDATVASTSLKIVFKIKSTGTGDNMYITGGAGDKMYIYIHPVTGHIRSSNDEGIDKADITYNLLDGDEHSVEVFMSYSSHEIRFWSVKIDGSSYNGADTGLMGSAEPRPQFSDITEVGQRNAAGEFPINGALYGVQISTNLGDGAGMVLRYQMAHLGQIPLYVAAGDIVPTVSQQVYVKNFYYLNAIISADNMDVLNEKPELDIIIKNKETAAETTVSNSWRLGEENESLYFTIPPATAVALYDLIVKSLFHAHAGFPLPLSIKPFAKSGGFVEDFSDTVAFAARWNFLHRAWGGANGGVVKENGRIENGELVLQANGDTYDSTVQGVDELGKPKFHTHANDPKLGQPWITRVGCAIVSKENYGYGSYKFVAKIPPLLGVASAFWTFHYEEIYPNDPRYADFQAEGLHEQGNATDGFYITRNHEIDIELPSNLDGQALNNVSLLNAKYNSWRGELKHPDPADPAYWEEYHSDLVNHGVDPTDGYHEYRFDWHADRIEFFMDGVLQTTITDSADGDVVPDIPSKLTIGMWFPSSNANSPLYPTWNDDTPWLANPELAWAGAEANWKTQDMRIKKIEFTPFEEVGERLIAETYPVGGLRSTNRLITQ